MKTKRNTRETKLRSLETYPLSLLVFTGKVDTNPGVLGVLASNLQSDTHPLTLPSMSRPGIYSAKMKLRNSW